MAAHQSTEPAAVPDVLAEVEQAIADLQAHPDASVRERVTTLLEGIDAVHRAGLTHLVQAIHGMTGDTLINRLIADPAIRMLLMSYDLIAVDRRLQAEEALDTVRGHLHEHGVDVEIQEVVGGVVYVRLHLSHQEGRDPLSLPRIRADLETALREFFIGFQELEFRDRDQQAPPSVVVPLAALRRANRPVYHDAVSAEEVPEGTMRAALVRDVSLLFAQVGGEVYAIRNQCGDSPLPLDLGTLEGTEVHCSWHGCRYDIRSGRRMNGDGRVQVFPVTTEAGRIRVALDVETGAR
ncbi:MAG: Rieske 2Fe-2S domain-containing protein [Acidobacteria bacterium]|nr:Rieske 2Fe-2S domain-containing protein [Acidobacteriota bacterium]